MVKKTKKKKVKRGKKPKLEMDFISMKTLEGRTTKDKVDSILDIVKTGRIVVLSRALTPDEETTLTTATMEEIEENFQGINFCSLREEKKTGVIIRLLEFFTGKKFSHGVTLVGPADKIENIKRESDKFHVKI